MSPAHSRVVETQIAVLGAGSFGTTLALHLARAGHAVHLIGRSQIEMAQIETTRENKKYLPGMSLPGSIRVISQAAVGALRAEVVLVAVPSHGFRTAVAGLSDWQSSLWILATKGLEESSGLRMSEVFAECAPERSDPVVLTGPSLAREIAEERPAALLVAAHDRARAEAAQSWLSTDRVRVYTAGDVIGAELAGALKNVVALAAGIADGLELGQNTRGALLTRGLAEMLRLGVRLGARSETFLGLAGMGDLVTTCTSPLSRNHEVGAALGRGESLDSILGRMVMVAEGVRTTQAAVTLSHRAGVEMPIAEQVARILFQGIEPGRALRELMTRPLRSE